MIFPLSFTFCQLKWLNSVLSKKRKRFILTIVSDNNGEGRNRLLLKENQIFLEIELGNRDDVLHLISQKAQELDITDDQEQLFKDLISREDTYSTAFQEGIAIPHAKSAAVKRAALIFIKMKEIIDWQSPDQFKVQNIFAILVPNVEAGTRHLQILSALAGQLMEEEFQERLATIQTKEDVLELLNSVEREVV